MLTEFCNVRQIPGEPRRRLFTSDFFNLYVWFGSDGSCSDFQLCYDINGDERALSYIKGQYMHTGIDCGELSWGSNMTPILVADGTFQSETVLEKFKHEALGLEEEIRSYVIGKIEAYSQQ